ncbi:1-acyl-sn-glycerol-3-phosphate acyltransferase [Pseudoalteromonas sp. MMG022]|uniref:1-acyl-sn-glycerol-3-phosphate acyltransferase n=1 Tax=Pseudoalteromonas sp. MMG022 TaxID=2909978 RepID=UPI001EFFBA09|nr:1-acyl-sn-glycerol-3-phosphate acyltransferase [Pseudoalteromonas sp. MMG022]MCF6436843.1 1-acyl-sn-glycerol-3-phosphate acyltransferase [Pseudoalteromonas sp. MMG022]
MIKKIETNRLIDVPKQLPRTSGRFFRTFGTVMLRMLGWRITGEFPQSGKFVAAVAPHTSNWDFFVAISVKLSLGIEIKFLGKHSIFVGPIGWLLKKMGGIAVERSQAHGMVAQITDVFNRSEALILGIAPEGTRKKTAKWKTGFLHIAKSANVPVVPMALDYRNKEFVIMPAQHIQGDIEQELQRFCKLFDKEMAKYPQQVSGD